MRELDCMARSAATDEQELERFLAEHEHFILRRASLSMHRYITKSDDEWSIALIAFAEAVRAYHFDKGSFLSFAENVIHRRLIDFQRGKNKYNNEIPVNPAVFGTDNDNEQDENYHVRKAVTELTAQEDHSIRYEIEALNETFMQYGFTFLDLAECSPKSKKNKIDMRKNRSLYFAQSLINKGNEVAENTSAKNSRNKSQSTPENAGASSKVYNSGSRDTFRRVSIFGRLYALHQGGDGQMKAVIVDIKGRFAAVLSDDGCIEKVKNNKYAIGQVIEMKERSPIKTSKLKIWAAAAAAFVILFGGASAYAYATPYSYVSVDVNPSIELSLNIFDRVLSVSAVNEDGTEVLSQIDLNQVNNQNINNAIATIVGEIENEGYFSQGEGGIVIATASQNPDKADVLAEQLDQTVNAALSGTEDPTASPDPNATPDPNASPAPTAPQQEGTNDSGIEVTVIRVGYDRVQEARELGVTPGKLNLVQKLQASAADEGDYATEEWIEKSVQQIQAEIKVNKKDAKEALPGETPAPEAEEGTTENTPEATSPASKTDLEKGKGNENSNGSKNSSSNGKVKEKNVGKSNKK